MKFSVNIPISTAYCIIITSNSKVTIKETTQCKQITLMFNHYLQKKIVWNLFHYEKVIHSW